MRPFLATIGAAVLLLLAACTAGPVVQAPPPSPTLSNEPHTIALLGATGMVGGYLIEEALQRGHSVRALARTPAKLDHLAGRLTIVQGDARDPEAIQALLRGSDVVISALGPVKADGKTSFSISSSATRGVLKEMEAQGIFRYFVVSGGGVAMPGDARDLLGWWIRTLAQLGLSETLQDKQAEYELLAASSAHWTLLRCPLIDPEPFEAPPLVSVASPPAFRLRAGELAQFIIDQIDSPDYVRSGPFLGSH